jgi:hypothetical protein
MTTTATLVCEVWRRHARVIGLTFEVFWIAVFLLDRIALSDGGGIPPFVYVNF